MTRRKSRRGVNVLGAIVLDGLFVWAILWHFASSM